MGIAHISLSVRLFEDASMMYTAFKQLQAVFSFLEKYSYGTSHHLKDICAPILRNSQKPSQLFGRLRSISLWIQVTQGTPSKTFASQTPFTMQAMENQAWNLFINMIFPLDMLLAYQLAQWKEKATTLVPQWLDMWYELEALCSLATYTYLNPDYTFPKILESESQEKKALFKAIGMGHPLLPDDLKVVNDVSFDQYNTLLLITGSNMAGKSTFLRTLGINLCLAYVGGPVNATEFQMPLFELHCCIRVSDSLVDGYSYFYAEVQRLKEIMDRLREPRPYPMFILIDEIFKGTNNRERLVGSTAYIYALTEYEDCTGAISTHDRTVTLANELPQVKNYHFREDVIDGEMTFDYCLRSGPFSHYKRLKNYATSWLAYLLEKKSFIGANVQYLLKVFSCTTRTLAWCSSDAASDHSAL